MSEPPQAHDHLLHRSIRVRVVRDVFEIIAFAAAGIWGLWTFWYQASYAPNHEKPAVDWKLGLEVVGRKSTGELAVRATVKAKNAGKAVDRVAAVAINLYGMRVGADTTADPFARIEANAPGWHEQIGSRQVASVLLASEGHHYGDDWRLTVEPGADFLLETMFVVPPDDYAFLQGEVTEISVMGTAPIKTAWFAEQRGADGPYFTATDACRSTRACDVTSTSDSTTLSLWPANASPPAASAPPAVFPLPPGH
jgi:hypothetical protein